jgi:hypothetical protein
MGRPYQFSNTPMKIRRPAPAFGEDNEYVLKGLLGLDEDTYQGLAQDSIIASVPTKGDPAPRPDPAKAVEMGLMAEWDPEYRERLGLS